MNDSFDFGVDIGYVSKVWEKEGEMTGLLDSDTYLYDATFFVDPLDYEKLIYERGSVEGTRLFNKLKSTIKRLVDKDLIDAGCDSAIIYLTDSGNNFRNEIGTVKKYKGQRASTKPPFFHELKAWMIDYYDAVLSDFNEADDEISIEVWERIVAFSKSGMQWTEVHKNLSNFIIISSDKDLNILPSWHFNKDTRQRYWVTPLGTLDPVFKMKKRKKFIWLPLFSGEVMYDTPTCLDTGLHFFIDANGDKVLQDHFSRGAKKGQGKFRRLADGEERVEALHALKGTGLKFFYSQLIVGDGADNYPGIEGKGPNAAYEALNPCTSEDELYAVTMEMYVKKYRHKAEERMMEQGTLAHMQTRKGELWRDLIKSQGKTFPL